MLTTEPVEMISAMRAVAGAFLFLSCLCGVAGVVLLARATRPLLRQHWVTEVAKLDGSRDLSPVPAVRKMDMRWAAGLLTLALLALLVAIFLIDRA